MMKKIRYFISIVLILTGVLATSCQSEKYLPHQNDTIYVNKVEYITDRILDSVYIDKYHTIYQKGDTIYKTDSIIDYRWRLQHDTILVKDTVYKSKDVEKIKEVNELTPFQHKEIVGFWILLSLILVVISFKIYKKVKK